MLGEATGPVLLVGMDRLIRIATPASADLLGIDPVGHRCCDVLGCRTPDVEWDGCITELVHAGGATRGALAIDSVPGTGRPLWVSGTPAPGAAGPGAMLRLGRTPPRGVEDPPDRKAPKAEELRIRVLGPTLVTRGGQWLSREWLSQRPGLLLKFLVTRRGGETTVDEIADALWPHLAAAGPERVRQSVHLLRRQLQPDVAPDDPRNVVLTRRSSYCLRTELVWVDAEEFERAARRGAEAFAAGDQDGAERDLLRALRLYRGDFLEEEAYADWALDERERLRELLDVPLRLLIEMRMEHGNLPGAARFAEELARLNPLDSDVQRLLLGIWTRQGRRTRVARHYEIYAARLRRSLGEEPDFTLADLRARAGS